MNMGIWPEVFLFLHEIYFKKNSPKKVLLQKFKIKKN